MCFEVEAAPVEKKVEKAWVADLGKYVEVPEGYHYLPAGIERRVRVNGGWLKGKDDRPLYYQVPVPGYELGQVFCEDIQILGPSQLVKGEDKKGGGCLGPVTTSPAAWVSTKAALLVKLVNEDGEEDDMLFWEKAAKAA